MKFVVPFLSGLALSNAFTMTCNDDKTLTVDIVHEGDAEVLELTYGDCTLDSIGNGVSKDIQDNGGNAEIQLILDIELCAADRNLRTLVYDHDARITIGRTGLDDQKLVLAEYVVDATCSFTDEYTVAYAYGVLEVESGEFTQDGGNREIGFEITPYATDAFLTELADDERVTTSGETVHLCLGVGSAFHDDFEYETKTFVPTMCEVTAGDFSYTLFDVDNSICDNAPVELAVTDANSLDSTMKWTISHIVFQFQDATADAEYTLTCNVKVCDVLETTDCDAARACLTGA